MLPAPLPRAVRAPAALGPQDERSAFLAKALVIPATAATITFLASSPEHTYQQRREEYDEEDEEQNFRDLCGAGGNAGETEDGRDDRDDEEYDCVSKHGVLLMKAGAPASVAAALAGRGRHSALWLFKSTLDLVLQ